MYHLIRMTVKTKKEEQSEKTREALIGAGRELFAEKGFAKTGTEELVARALVSRGALYHQFQDKENLFLAVFEAVESDLCARVASTVAGISDVREMMNCGCEAFLDICQEQEVRRIALIDAPAVLGWEVWRTIDAKYGLGLVRGIVQLAAKQGSLDVELIDEISHLLLGALSEAAMVVAHHPNDTAVRQRVAKSLQWLIDGLFFQREK